MVETSTALIGAFFALLIGCIIGIQIGKGWYGSSDTETPADAPITFAHDTTVEQIFYTIPDRGDNAPLVLVKGAEEMDVFEEIQSLKKRIADLEPKPAVYKIAIGGQSNIVMPKTSKAKRPTKKSRA